MVNSSHDGHAQNAKSLKLLHLRPYHVYGNIASRRKVKRVVQYPEAFNVVSARDVIQRSGQHHVYTTNSSRRTVKRAVQYPELINIVSARDVLQSYSTPDGIMFMQLLQVDER
ncbi:hypothetical protein J6590_052351 [Homalodisca vitripennis]|nr:hypothetical protein J6590_052351 [Homalodisca vitripennis]